jgi:AcrR family transcriptional regulator
MKNSQFKTQKQLQSEQTRQLIVETATHLFARRGFYGTSISDLTQAVGLTKGALYYHFKDKDALFFAVVDSVRNIWDQALGDEITNEKNSLTQISILFDKHTEIISNNQFLCLVMSNLMSEMESVNPEYALIVESIYDDFILYIEQIIQLGQKNNEIRSDLDPRLVALNVIGIFKTIGCFPELKNILVNRAEMAITVKKVFLDGLKP